MFIVLSKHGFDFINNIVIDPMHAVCQNTIRRTLDVISKSVSNKIFLEIGNRFASLTLGKEFTRSRPRDFTMLPRFKSTELRHFLLYGGDICMKGIVADTYLNAWRRYGLYNIYIY